MDHKGIYLLNTAASGISEEDREFTMLLNDIVQLLDDFTDKQHTERRDHTEVDPRLFAAGETILDQPPVGMSLSTYMQGESNSTCRSRRWVHNES